MYQHSEELSELSRTADVIITEILEDDRVIEKVYDIKERSADMYEHSISLCTLATIMALKYQYDGRGMAIAGIVTGGIGIFIWLIVLLVAGSGFFAALVEEFSNM